MTDVCGNRIQVLTANLKRHRNGGGGGAESGVTAVTRADGVTPPDERDGGTHGLRCVLVIVTLWFTGVIIVA